MTKMTQRHLVWMLLYLAAGLPARAIDEEELLRSFGDRDTVSIATGSRQPIARAPAVASVVTAEDIRASGAADLDEVLRSVPGLHVSVSPGGYNPIYVIRGLHTQLNPQVLVLLNGIPLTNVFIGDRGQAWGGMPVQNIQRIEVIRGPGSALYGADAFSGVVNVVTKTALDIEGTQLGARVGSFDTADAWLLRGSKWGGANVAVAVELGKTNGFDEKVSADQQSGLDAAFGTNASLAPGPVSTGKKYLDLRLDVGLDKWRFRAGYQARRNVGTGVGAAQALDPVGASRSDRFNLDLTHTTRDLLKNWEIQTQASFFDVTTKSDLVLFPKGAFGGTFPEGMIGNPDVYERHARLGLIGQYEGFAKHRLRLGAGINFDDLYKVGESKNYFLDPASPIPVPLGSLVDVSNTAPFVRTEDRKVVYAFAQDEWSILPDWTLTAGVRADRYSDVGTTINPRLALVWETRYNLTSKLLFGRAFRAPSFQELYNINNPVAVGNPSLKPETIETIELAFAYRPAGKLSAGLNLFYYELNDALRLIAAKSQNAGGQHGYGLELETGWDATPNLRIGAHYALQRTEDAQTNTDPGNAPRNQAYLRLDWRFAPGWALNAQTKWVSKRQRPPGDARTALDGYALTDLNLARRFGSRHAWELAVSVRNLFDEKALEPSSLMPDDLPLAGRAVRFEVRHQF